MGRKEGERVSQVFPAAILPKHTAILGMTGSGKSTTARDLVEQVVAEGSRVCILDTVKSDWWGITSSADGKRPGLPFTILGGPHAHLPLSRTMGKAIADVVANGSLPLSIVDMADFGPGDASHFFVDFAERLFKKTKGVLYLVIEEAHELAPKERVGFEKENMGVYWAKKLATGARSRGLRMVVLTQRSQSLHNAVLGSCENMVVMRMTAPADQKPAVDWLKANVKDKELRTQVTESISSLPDGAGWICSGAAKLFELVKFPRATTYDNTAAPTDDEELKAVKMATVDVEQLRTILSTAVKEAEASDPALLRKRIAELERDLRKAKPGLAEAIRPVGIDTSIIERQSFERGHLEGGRAALQEMRSREAAARKEGFDIAVANMKGLHQTYVARVRQIMDGSVVFLTDAAIDIYDRLKYEPANNPLVPFDEMTKILQRGAARMVTNPEGVALTSMAHPKGNGKAPRARLNPASLETIEIDVPLTGVQKKIIDALAELEQVGISGPPRELLCFMAGYSHLKSKGFTNAIGALRTGGLIQGTALTDLGRQAAKPAPGPLSPLEFQAKVIELLGGATGRVLKPLIDVYPDEVERGELVKAAGFGHANSKGFTNAIGRLRTLGFIDYPSRGTVVAKPVLFLQ
jgi:hypothetical protein